MTDFLRAQYEQTRQNSLLELAAMQQRNEEYAEKNGGVENLPENVRRTYEARKNTIIRIVIAHDRAQEYIEDLQTWIGDLIQKNRSLTAELQHRDANMGWEKYFHNTCKPNENDSERENRRRTSKILLLQDCPNLF